MGNTQASVQFDDGDAVNFEHGEKLSDIIQFYGPGYLRNLEDNSVVFAQDKVIPKGRYRFIKKKVAAVGYEVRASIFGALSCAGARGNVYKLLERHHGGYSEAEGHGASVTYSSNDLTIKAYFKSYDKACDFQNELNSWEMHKELVNLAGVNVAPREPLEVVLPSDFQPFTLLDYDPSASESPRGDLDMLGSYRISVPITEAVESNSPLVMYQSVDIRQLGLKHDKCHLYDKAKNKAYQNNENNMIAASWLFHQMLDGLHTDEKIPLLRLSFTSSSARRQADNDNRYAVTLGIEFKDEALARNYQCPEGGIQVDNKNWEVTVHVQNKEIFEECVNWKYEDTTKKWELYDGQLNIE